MTDKINIEEIFKKYANLYQFEEGDPEYLLDKEDFKAAIKEIVEAVVDKCAEEVKLTEFGYEAMQEYSSKAIDKQCILNVKTLVVYE